MNTETGEFEIHRKRLFGIAYRMLGSVMDAQDIVQDTYVQWQSAPQDEIRSARAWLTTVATRLCINRRKSARVQRGTSQPPSTACLLKTSAPHLRAVSLIESIGRLRPLQALRKHRNTPNYEPRHCLLIKETTEEFPFTLIADPSLHHYHDFGVETSPWALVHASVIGALLRSLRTEKFRLPKVENGRLGLPADILLNHTGRVIACKYGRHAYDQWIVDEVLGEASRKTQSDMPACGIESRLVV